MLDTTRAMIRYFDRHNLKYKDDIHTAKSGKDVVTVNFGGDHMDTISLKVFVDDDNIAIYVWSICKASSAGKIAALLPILNSLNHEYRWYRFYLDNDDEVAAQIDATITTDTVGPVARELLMRGAQIVDEAYPKMMKALWS